MLTERWRRLAGRPLLGWLAIGFLCYSSLVLAWHGSIHPFESQLVHVQQDDAADGSAITQAHQCDLCLSAHAFGAALVSLPPPLVPVPSLHSWQPPEPAMAPAAAILATRARAPPTHLS